MKNKNFIQRIKERNKYATNKRQSFYDLAGEYLPKDKNKTIIDIGCGYGFFADYLKLYSRYKNLYLLDADPEVVKKVQNAVCYEAPDVLPFADNSVHFIHCSHLVEHLYTEQLLKFLREMDRVLAKDGILIISAPLLQHRFYEGLAHIKPYGPEGLINYMCDEKEKGAKKIIAGADGGFISDKYIVEDLVYRHIRNLDDSAWGSKYLIVSIFMEIVKKVFSALGFFRYTKNGYTLILRKQ